MPEIPQPDLDPDEPAAQGTYRGQAMRNGGKTYLWNGKRWRRAEEIVVATPKTEAPPHATDD